MTFLFPDEDDIFQAELLPAYAKTYILPRKMRRASFALSSPEASLGERSVRRQSHARRQSTVTPEFTMSILKASLEERKISNGSDIIEEEEEGEEEGDRMMVMSRNNRKSLVPCNASGGMREYADFVKQGNFIPTSVLDPDLGMEAEVFAEVKSSGGGLRSGRMSEMSLREGEVMVNLDEAFTRVTEMLGKVEAGAEQRRSSIVTSEAAKPQRHKGRRVRARPSASLSLDHDLPTGGPGATTSDIFGFNLNPDSDSSSRSSGYQSQQEFYVEGELFHFFNA